MSVCDRRTQQEARIPFDDTNFRDPPPEPPPTAPRLSRRDETILLVLLVIGAFVALLLPISAACLSDVARALGAR